MEIDLNLHTEECQKSGCNCDNKESFLYSYEYRFEYIYKTYRAKINSCFRSFNGTPHSEILDMAIRKIKNELNLKVKPNYYSEISNHTGSYLQHKSSYREYEIPSDEVIELVSEGGYGRKYFVVHKISDLNLEEILNKETILYSDKFRNTCYLAERLPKSQALIKKITDSAKS